MSDARNNNWNKSIIDEFRTNHGKVGGYFAGSKLLLLTTTGAKSGNKHTTPLMYNVYNGRVLVFGSKGGAPTHPAWYHNLLANPHVTIEMGDERYNATAVVIKGEERDKLYKWHSDQVPQFAKYQEATTRTIPVIELVRQNEAQ